MPTVSENTDITRTVEPGTLETKEERFVHPRMNEGTNKYGEYPIKTKIRNKEVKPQEQDHK